MGTRSKNEYTPDSVSPPGATLAEVLDGRDMTQAELAERLDRPPAFVEALCGGRVALTPDLARKLARATRVPASFWINRECHYRDGPAS